MSIIVVDCEAPFGKGSPSVADMTEFGAVYFESLYSQKETGIKTFHGMDCTQETFQSFKTWLAQFPKPLIFVSDNVAYDWQWINFYFWKYYGENPFGHSGRRISDYYAGLTGKWGNTQIWKRLRRTKHDHNPVHDALGNAEALMRIFNGER